ncbi:MAG: glycosyltransferase family 4 protein [Candidatus Helarchaeota archaeon]
MNICLFSRIIREHGLGGGMEVHGDIICRGLLENGHKITIITGEHHYGKKCDVEENKKIYYLSGVTPYKYTKKWWIESIKKFVEIAETENFDIIWSQSAGALSWIRFLRKKYNIPCVATIHGTPFGEIMTRARNVSSVWSLFRLLLSFLKNIYYKLSWEKNYRFLSAAIMIAQNLIKPFQKFYSLDTENIFYIPNGVDTNYFSPGVNREDIQKIREKYQINQKDRILLTTGRLEKDKGGQFVINSLQKIIFRIPKIKLIVVGTGNYEDELKKLTKKQGVEKHVIFCGFIPRENLPTFYNLCDIFLLPSRRYEGFPFVLAEAMACSKPIIASNIGGIPSVIDDGISGILVPPGDVNALTEKIILVLKNKELAKELAKNAREKTVREFSQEKMVSKTIGVFEKCLEEKKFN